MTDNEQGEYEDTILRLNKRLSELEGLLDREFGQCVYCGQRNIPINTRDHWLMCQSHPAHARIAELEAQLAEARKDLFARQNGWIKLCAAIARMPAVVECSRHRNGLVEIDIDYIRQRLIDTWKQIEADLERDTIDAAREDS